MDSNHLRRLLRLPIVFWLVAVSLAVCPRVFSNGAIEAVGRDAGIGVAEGVGPYTDRLIENQLPAFVHQALDDGELHAADLINLAHDKGADLISQMADKLQGIDEITFQNANAVVDKINGDISTLVQEILPEIVDAMTNTIIILNSDIKSYLTQLDAVIQNNLLYKNRTDFDSQAIQRVIAQPITLNDYTLIYKTNKYLQLMYVGPGSTIDDQIGAFNSIAYSAKAIIVYDKVYKVGPPPPGVVQDFEKYTNYAALLSGISNDLTSGGKE